MPNDPGMTIDENEALIVLTIIHAQQIPKNKDSADVSGLLRLTVFITNLGHEFAERPGQGQSDWSRCSQSQA